MIRYMMPVFAAVFATAAAADIEKTRAEGDVPQVMDRLEEAVTKAGATVFARVNHAGGAEDVGMELTASQLLIFGNPKLGTPAMQDDVLAGLYLPLKVLVYADDSGQTWIAWEEPEDTFDDLSIDDDAEYLEKMEDALKNFTKAAKE